MKTEYRITPLSSFRRDSGRLTEWVRHSGGRIWLTKHGKAVAAVIPMFQCERLETWENVSLAEKRRQMEEGYARWKAVKALSGDTAERDFWDRGI
ncbi:type II toxin-antitoxin system Phd/YefM family antitoxin [Primorskyibacter marinus]|uniref:type II toxin-antitoxin system Phd/YefM family antitoxin n=1 Tax=Primorskyibacter marinus TaxID=1977320 RepID=UPI000E3055B7|nr:type II toxin-antitoxin system Phd/YefM family antitoxin [Primorskyibacter marinus]